MKDVALIISLLAIPAVAIALVGLIYSSIAHKKKYKWVIALIFSAFVFVAMVFTSSADAPESKPPAKKLVAEITTEATTKVTAAETTKVTTMETTMSEKEKRAAAKDFPYKTIARDPDRYAGEYIKVTGEIVQVMEDTFTVLRLAQDSDYDQMWVVEYYRPVDAPRVLEGDLVTIYGNCTGLFSYESIMGGKISIPGLFSILIDIDSLE